jgi:TPP-dependent pyruvate/acetoin dehydrogenase alpha subunit
MTTTAAASSPVDYAKASVNAELSPEKKIELLHQMVRIRRFEQTALQA